MVQVSAFSFLELTVVTGFLGSSREPFIDLIIHSCMNPLKVAVLVHT